MDVRFPITGTPGLAAPGSALAAPGRGQAASGASGPSGFASALDSALQTVSRLQDDSVSMQRQFQLGTGQASLEQTMMAMQSAQIGFQAALTVRNRLVAAYTDIMNMPV